MIFSPNNDGRKDQTEMKIDIKDAVESRLEILDSSNQNVLTQTLPPQSGSYIWDGKNKKNETVADGSYKAVLKVKDQAGNVSTDEKLVTVLNLETQISLTGNRNLLNPKNQDINHIRFKSALPRLELIEKITMVTLDKDKDEVIEKQHPKPEEKNFEFSFNGLEDDDDYLEDGEYTQKIIVEYTNGDVLESNTVPFRMDQTGPEASLAISPSIFSPDGDGENDILKIDLKANDPTGINTWYIVIEDRFKDIFKSFKGQRNIPDNIQWDGRSNKGELTDSAEDYIIYAIVSDNAGNLTTTEKIHFNTDILVIKTDRGYKIRISNIHFDLNKAELKPQAVNILNKVADKLKKFPDYKVRIEGHADSTGRESWNEKLSLLRAESVRNYLVDEKDLAPEMFITEGFGSKIPLYPNDTPKNRAKNRRVEFILIK
jgi:outer membrane protein OmpA-like peptidoglycan-associated protein